jgi:GMP synthase (glutamine-hydrolysing)
VKANAVIGADIKAVRDHTEALSQACARCAREPAPPMNKPVLILQNLSNDGPAYLGQWLQGQGIAAEVRNTEAGDVYPEHIGAYSALAVLGGAMSANDALPSLRRAESLILQAFAQDIPVLGHCLGGQLMARALGAVVGPSPAPEIGWQTMQLARGSPAARDWLGDAPDATVMHWHSEAFSLPPGAKAMASSPACPVQAFAIGPHVAMQFHIEVDAAKVELWSNEESEAWAAAQVAFPSSVQNRHQMRAGLALHLPAHQAMAQRIYARWVALRRR